jgi:hypothetical protein
MRLLCGLRFLTVLAALVSLAGLSTAPAESPKKVETPSREIGIEPINETPGWLVRVSVPRESRTYKLGESITINVVSERDGYLYLFSLDAGGEVGILFPNRFQNNNRIEANKPITVPDPGDKSFKIQVAPPFGKEVIWAVVTKNPAPELAGLALANGPTVISGDKFREMVSRLATGEASRNVTIRQAKERIRAKNPQKYARQCLDWSEHKLEIATVGNDSSPGRSQRVGLFVGVSKYSDPGIRRLGCSHKDAIRMKGLMETVGEFDRTTLLIDQHAKLANIRAAFSSIVASTKAGDTVLIYWSGHGGRCPNLDGTEPDGLDAYLVPHDGQLENTRDTMLIDKAFGRWIQELDGRQVMVILDTCHSGGQIEGMKAPKKLDVNRDGTPKFSRGIDTPGVKRNSRWTKKFFLDRENIRIKSIGQKDAGVLSACTFKQFAFEREEQDFGVMTYFIVQRLTQATGPVSLADVVTYVKNKVPDYVNEHFPGSPQSPVSSQRTNDPDNKLRP